MKNFPYMLLASGEDNLKDLCDDELPVLIFIIADTDGVALPQLLHHLLKFSFMPECIRFAIYDNLDGITVNLPGVLAIHLYHFQVGVTVFNNPAG
jgi:hypothetical protein